MGILAKSQRSATLLVTPPTHTHTYRKPCSYSVWAINYGSTQCLNFRNWRRLDRVNPVVVLYLCMCACVCFHRGGRAEDHCMFSPFRSDVRPERIHKMTSSSHGTGRHKWISPLWRETAFINESLMVDLYFPTNPPQDAECPLTHGVAHHTTEKQTNTRAGLSSRRCLKYHTKDLPSHLSHCLVISVNRPKLLEGA